MCSSSRRVFEPVRRGWCVVRARVGAPLACLSWSSIVVLTRFCVFFSFSLSLCPRLIHANHGEGILKYLCNALRNSANNETIQHGACLGLGLAGMATGNEELYEDLRVVLFSDNAVAGEAAGLAMGLVMLGTASEKAIEEMVSVLFASFALVGVAAMSGPYTRRVGVPDGVCA